MKTAKYKDCKFHRLDTLADGAKEDYCYPPLLYGLLSTPRKVRYRKQKTAPLVE